MSYLNAFTTQIEAFSSELCAIYPQDTDLKLGHNMITLLKKTNPRKLQQLYKDYVAEFEEQIEKKDETFFIKHDFKNVIDSSGSQNSFLLVVKLKEYWGELSNDNKEITWKYFQVLSKLSKKIDNN